MRQAAKKLRSAANITQLVGANEQPANFNQNRMDHQAAGKTVGSNIGSNRRFVNLRKCSSQVISNDSNADLELWQIRAFYGAWPTRNSKANRVPSPELSTTTSTNAHEKAGIRIRL